MDGPTRCCPDSDLTPLRCRVRNAQSRVSEISAVAMRQLIERLRPRVRRYAAPLVAGLRGPRVSLARHVESALAAVGTSLAECTAVSDSAFYAWVSSSTTSSVLEQHMYDAAHQLHRRRRALRVRRLQKQTGIDTGRDNAA